MLVVCVFFNVLIHAKRSFSFTLVQEVTAFVLSVLFDSNSSGVR